MVRLTIFVFSVLLLSACSSSESAPEASAPAETPPVAAVTPPASPPAESPEPAAAAPPATPSSALSFRAYDGREVAIEDYEGKVVAVMFFSTDCPHCQNTAQILAPIYREYRQKGTEILGIAVNPSAATNLGGFVARYGVEFPVGLGTRMQWASYAKFSITKNAYVPHLLFVGKDGKIAEDHPGGERVFWQNQAENIRASFDRLLAQ